MTFLRPLLIALLAIAFNAGSDVDTSTWCSEAEHYAAGICNLHGETSGICSNVWEATKARCLSDPWDSELEQNEPTDLGSGSKNTDDTLRTSDVLTNQNCAKGIQPLRMLCCESAKTDVSKVCPQAPSKPVLNVTCASSVKAETFVDASTEREVKGQSWNGNAVTKKESKGAPTDTGATGGHFGRCSSTHNCASCAAFQTRADGTLRCTDEPVGALDGAWVNEANMTKDEIRTNGTIGRNYSQGIQPLPVRPQALRIQSCQSSSSELKREGDRMYLPLLQNYQASMNRARIQKCLIAMKQDLSWTNQSIFSVDVPEAFLDKQEELEFEDKVITSEKRALEKQVENFKAKVSTAEKWLEYQIAFQMQVISKVTKRCKLCEATIKGADLVAEASGLLMLARWEMQTPSAETDSSHTGHNVKINSKVMAPKQVLLQPPIWTAMLGLLCSASQGKAHVLFGLAVWGTSCTTAVHGFQMETGLQLITDDDDVPIGEGQGRRGGGALLQTSGTFTLSSGNRAGNSERQKLKDLGAALQMDGRLAYAHMQAAENVHEIGTGANPEYVPDVEIGEGQGRRGGGAVLQTSGTFALSSGNRAGNSERQKLKDLGAALQTGGGTANLGFTQEPSAATVGYVFPTQPVVAMQDAQGNTVTDDSTTSVAMSVHSGPGTLSGTLTKAALSGLATFTDLLLNETGTHVLRATATIRDGSLPLAVPSCSASSEYSDANLPAGTYACTKAFDGSLSTAWATQGQGSGSWIKAELGNMYTVTAFKYQNRAANEANKAITVSFSLGAPQTFTLAQTGLDSHTLNPPVATSSVTITVDSAYTTFNNGALKIEIYAKGQPAATKIKSGHECSSGAETNLSQQESVEACLAACVAAKGDDCKYFVFGTGSKAGRCWWEETCTTFTSNQYDVYSVNSGSQTADSASFTVAGLLESCPFPFKKVATSRCALPDTVHFPKTRKWTTTGAKNNTACWSVQGYGLSSKCGIPPQHVVSAFGDKHCAHTQSAEEPQPLISASVNWAESCVLLLPESRSPFVNPATRDLGEGKKSGVDPIEALRIMSRTTQCTVVMELTRSTCGNGKKVDILWPPKKDGTVPTFRTAGCGCPVQVAVEMKGTITAMANTFNRTQNKCRTEMIAFGFETHQIISGMKSVRKTLRGKALEQVREFRRATTQKMRHVSMACFNSVEYEHEIKMALLKGCQVQLRRGNELVKQQVDHMQQTPGLQHLSDTSLLLKEGSGFTGGALSSLLAECKGQLTQLNKMLNVAENTSGTVDGGGNKPVLERV